MDITRVGLHPWCGFTDPWLVEDWLVPVYLALDGLMHTLL